MADATTTYTPIKQYCIQMGQMCEFATDFGYCQLTACSKQNYAVKELDQFGKDLSELAVAIMVSAKDAGLCNNKAERNEQHETTD